MDHLLSVMENVEFQLGYNEYLFFGSLLFWAGSLLFAFRLGKIYIYVLIALLTVLMNIFAVKPFEIFGLSTYGGNVMYGIVFLATDLLSEHYGKKEALQGVKIGLLALVAYIVSAVLFVEMVPNLEAEGVQDIQNAYEKIFSPAWVIVIGSLSAYVCSNTFDVYFYHFIRSKTGEKYLWLRNNLSTLISQLIDTVVFTFLLTVLDFNLNLGFVNIELIPVFEWQFFGEVLIFMYIIKLIVAILDTPFLYLSKVIARKYSLGNKFVKS